MRVDLKDQVALVTGAARGIGLAIGKALAANGAMTVFTDLDEEEARGTASGMPGTAEGFAMDVTDEGAVESIVGKVVDAYGRLDIVVNNAGVNTLAHRVTIDQFPRSEWDRLLAVDLTGVYTVSRESARVMKEQGSGVILNVASIAGLVPLRLQCAFTAAKAGVVNLTRAMAIELAQAGIRVNCIAPGSILTEGTEKLFYGAGSAFQKDASRVLGSIPMGRPGTVEEVAHAALFLVAPESSYITGALLMVDGGWTAGYVRDF
jgi:NAD(P)-dependent dehydrogenase (short-subunit alcohol dehydrogenase family)